MKTSPIILDSVQLSRDHSQVQASFKKENDLRLAKEGEVAILRKSMEKACSAYLL